MSQLVSIGTAVPEYKYTQEKILQFMLKGMDEQSDKERRLLSFIFKKSGIAHRHSILPDFDLDTEKSALFRDSSTTNVEDRMELFNAKAPLLLSKAIDKCLNGIDHKDITHIISVSCTGLSAPGLDVELTDLLKLSDTVERSAVNFMGCHGGFHAMRQAHYICSHQPTANVLIADVELSTIHFQKNTSSDEMLANTLFADGAAAVLVSGAESSYQSKLKVANFHSKLVLKGKAAMAWKISSQGFLMNLSTQVPNLISADFHRIIKTIFAHDLPDYGMDEVLWAFHPGGVRVLESITKIAGITKEQMWASYQVLKDNGNMSSCTIFFVLEQLMQESISTNKPVVAAGFGPGLSMELMTLQAK
jgi:predicted naringenin-chalcone synthase